MALKLAMSLLVDIVQVCIKEI